MHKFPRLTKIAQLTAGLSLTSLITPLAVSAQTKPWSGVCVSETDPDVATIQGLQCLLANVLSIFLTTLGLVGFVMLIVGSMRWLLSGGSSQNVDKARKTMTYALVGLVVALMSFIILRLIAQFTGVNTIMNFTIPDSSKNWGQPPVYLPTILRN